jgi:hypothetical protein
MGLMPHSWRLSVHGDRSRCKRRIECRCVRKPDGVHRGPNRSYWFPKLGEEKDQKYENPPDPVRLDMKR